PDASFHDPTIAPPHGATWPQFPPTPLDPPPQLTAPSAATRENARMKLRMCTRSFESALKKRSSDRRDHRGGRRVARAADVQRRAPHVPEVLPMVDADEHADRQLLPRVREEPAPSTNGPQ